MNISFRGPKMYSLTRKKRESIHKKMDLLKSNLHKNKTSLNGWPSTNKFGNHFPTS